MPGARWTLHDVDTYLRDSGRPLAPGSMALPSLPGSVPGGSVPCAGMSMVASSSTLQEHPPYWPYRSRTEQRYADILTQRQREGQIRHWWYEPLKLRLGEKCYYTADFLVIDAIRPYELLLVETKGRRVWDDAVVKTKTAARMYPCFVFVWAQWKHQAWTERVIRPV